MHRRFRMVGFVLALLAWVATLTLPLYSAATETVGPSGTTTVTTDTATLLEINGWSAVVPGLLLVVLALGVWISPAMLVRWLCLLVFLALTALGLASLGIFFLPAALFLILGVSLDRGEPQPSG